MIEHLGNFSLAGAALGATVSLMAALVSIRSGDAAWLGRARVGLGAVFGCLTLACIALGTALVEVDFGFAYVASHTERALSAPYRLVAFWSGQEGSLLLWGWMLAGVSAGAAVLRRRRGGVSESASVATLALVCLFFAALLMFAANPFVRLPGPVPADGHGLNPQLQHWAMVIHPPVLFMGYAGFVVPMAIMVGALVGGRADNAWAGEVRRWVIVAWLFLTAGIVLGAWWAYVELGWGGYWAWDPVENASLLPWLTGTALIHAVVIHEHRGMQKFWTAGLAAGSFILCIFGTYVTRSGVIESVHAFGESLIGTFFLAFLGFLVVACSGLIVWRRRLLRPQSRMESVVGREGMFLLGNTLLVIMMAVTLVGTILPVLTGVFSSRPLSVGAPFYNSVVAPMGLLLAAVMAVGPILVYGAAAAGTLKRGLLIPALLSGVILAVAAVLGLRNAWALATLGIAVLAVAIILFAFDRSARSQMRRAGAGPVMATLRVIDSNHRRYGGQLAHLGLVLAILGIAGSSLYGVKSSVTLIPGQTVEVGRYELRLDSISDRRHDNYTTVEAVVSIVGKDGRERVLTPERRFYDKAEGASSEVAIRTGLREDLYVALAGWEDAGARVALEVLVNPLVVWIWIGTIVLSLGALFALLPRLLPKPRLAEARVAARRIEPAAGSMEHAGA